MRENVIIYTCEYWLRLSLPRNAGPFWEPGANGVYLSIALLLNLVMSKQLFNRKNIVFILTIITTFSAGAYISLFIIISFYFIFQRDRIKGAFLALVLLFLFIISFFSFSFLGQKFSDNYDDFSNTKSYIRSYKETSERVGRFTATQLDIKKFMESPIIGSKLSADEISMRDTNTFTTLLRHYGVLGVLLISFYFFKTSQKLSIIFNGHDSLMKYAILFILFAVGLTQGIGNSPFYLSFLFMFLVLKKGNYYNQFTETSKTRPNFEKQKSKGFISQQPNLR